MGLTERGSLTVSVTSSLQAGWRNSMPPVAVTVATRAVQSTAVWTVSHIDQATTAAPDDGIIADGAMLSGVI